MGKLEWARPPSVAVPSQPETCSQLCSRNPTFQSRFWGCRGHNGRSRLPGRMYSGGVQSIGSISKPFFRFPLSEGPEASGQHKATRGPTISLPELAPVWVPPAPPPPGGIAWLLCPAPAPMPPAPPRSPSVKTLRKDKELQSTPLKASDGSRLLSRSRTWRTWIRASRTVYGSVRRETASVTRALLPATTHPA